MRVTAGFMIKHTENKNIHGNFYFFGGRRGWGEELKGGGGQVWRGGGGDDVKIRGGHVKGRG